ncbi:DNA cytosine methyltransferase [Rossellomorea marisflavi]|nr:DNA cytosine methyltransferase [Rossellomorea marisflavi]
MAEGFIQAGFIPIAATDMSREVAETYENRHRQLGYSTNYYCGDIKDLINESKIKDLTEGQDIDVVVGGPPCQGFSLSGKRDLNDPRNLLFIDYLRIVNLVKPKYFVMENVEGILSYEFKNVKGIFGEYCNVTACEVIIKEALNIGYKVKYKVLNAKDYGIPQNRPRVIFIGHKIEIINNKIFNTYFPPMFPKKKIARITVEDAISDLKFLKAGQRSNKYDNRFGNKSLYQTKLRKGLTPSIFGSPIALHELYNHQSTLHSDVVTKRFQALNQGESVGQLINRLPSELKTELMTNKYRCTKLKSDKVAPTILTLPDDIVHYEEKNPRILTVRELARIQSFDDSFIFYGNRTTGGKRRKLETPQYTQVGNAVPPLLAKAVAEEIMRALRKVENKEEVLCLN